MRLIKYFGGVFLLILISGCQNSIYSQFGHDPTRYPAAGSIVVLNQPITVYPGYSRSFIQHGKNVSKRELDERNPWCQFRLYEPPSALETTRTIKPDRFLVTESDQRYTKSTIDGIQLASRILVAEVVSPGRSSLTLSSVMKVEASGQPQVVEFKCAIFTDPAYDNFVSINEMTQTLGDLVTLEIKR